MAVKALHAPRPRGTALGRRVDESVVRGRASAPGHRGLTPVRERRSDVRDFNAYDMARPAFDLEAPGALAPPEVCATRTLGGIQAAPSMATAAPAIDKGGISAPDPMFDRDVESARRLATPVRSVRTSVERVVSAQVGNATSVPALTAKYRFTNRGLRILVALGFALSIGIGGTVGAVMADEGFAGETTTVVVHPGDSLWSIASALTQPGEDVRPLLQEIVALNGLEGSVITSGQNLLVPSR